MQQNTIWAQNEHIFVIFARYLKSRMSRVFLLLMFFIPFPKVYAQIHEVGIFGGGGNYIGDIGKTTYVAPDKPVLGFIYKYNKSKRLAYRFSYTYAEVYANDNQADVDSRIQRGLSFENTINELYLGLEFNFFDFDLHLNEYQLTPYISSGIGYFKQNELFFRNNELIEDGEQWNASIPMIVGIKTNISYHWILGFEVGARYTFSDNIDGSFPKSDQRVPLRFGNLNSKDWYVFTGITLTYTFGDNPCFCPH